MPHAREMLQRVIATQLKRGAKKSEIIVRGCPDPVIQFDLPEPEDEKEAGRSAPAGGSREADDSDQDADDPPADHPAAPRLGPTRMQTRLPLNVTRSIV